jgi:hypothetical protein
LLGDGGRAYALTLTASDLSGSSLRLDSSGYGGASAATAGATAFGSGAGKGGLSQMDQNDGTVGYTTIELLSEGRGGGGGPAAAGTELAALAGDGTGHHAGGNRHRHRRRGLRMHLSTGELSGVAVA